MGTPSAIAVKTDAGYKTIYCHWDGYPSHMYPLLRDWYATHERAEALVSFGDASSINKRLVSSHDSAHSFSKPEEDVCVFYHRDRGDTWLEVAPVFMTRAEIPGLQYYVYIFEDGEWRVYIHGQEAEDYSKFDD